jgi:ClpA/ClpB-like protein
MLERYTEKARRVIFFGRYEASEFGSAVIDTEHLLLGLVREEKLVCFRWVPKAQPETIRAAVEGWTKRQPKVPTSTDLPLSEASKRVLFHAKDEADRLNSKHIGTEHLLLGLMQEECPASKLLRELGADIAKLRVRFERDWERTNAPPVPDSSTLDHLRSAIKDRLRSAAGETVQIHGLCWNADYIRDGVKRCHTHNWHWQKASWKHRDVVIHRKTGKLSQDLTLVEDQENFELIKAGWKKDYCAICGWELFEAEDNHGTGYTNGRQWVCVECYDKFWERPDFISGSYSDLT